MVQKLKRFSAEACGNGLRYTVPTGLGCPLCGSELLGETQTNHWMACSSPHCDYGKKEKKW
jgi:hypothetical protein